MRTVAALLVAASLSGCLVAEVASRAVLEAQEARPTAPTPPAPEPPPVEAWVEGLGGEGPEFDGKPFQGKRIFTPDPGTLVGICVFGREAGTIATVGVMTAPSNEPLLFTVDVPVTADQAWSCAAVEVAWSHDQIFLYKAAGDAEIGLDDGWPIDSWWSDDEGRTWSGGGPQPWRRGYKVVLATGPLPPGAHPDELMPRRPSPAEPAGLAPAA